MEDEKYSVPAPVMQKGKVQLWRVEFTMRQLGEALLISVLLFFINSILDILGNGVLGEVHLVIMLALISAGAWYVFIPVSGRVGTAWLILAVRWYRNQERHLVYSHKARGPRLLRVYQKPRDEVTASDGQNAQ